MFPRPAAQFILFLALVCVPTLAGCVSTPDPGGPDDKTPFLANAEPQPGSRIGAVSEPFNFVYRTDPAMLSEIRNGIGDKTLRVWDKGHGTQIEYYAANGRSYLWYPGNTGVVSGRWTVEEKSQDSLLGIKNTYAKICTQYGPDTYNPVTHATGATPDCTDVASYKIHTEELAPGDPFRLATGKVPFILRDKKIGLLTLDEIYAQMTSPR